ncbi:MAG: hypothetical protein HIU89_04345 [Proteobacteria bacterium]|nr:hypothetical protein [Pseudomonadota bacterium]
MQPDWILEKTAAGREALVSRAHHLPAVARGVLVLINGERTVSALLDCATDKLRWQEALILLLEQGYVSPNSGAFEPTPSARAQDFGASPLRGSDLRADLSRLVTQMFGQGADKLLQKLQAADHSPQSQMAAVESCTKYIKLFIDEKKSNEFRDKAQTLIDGKRGVS